MMRAGVRADRPFLSLSVRGALSLFFFPVALLMSQERDRHPFDVALGNGRGGGQGGRAGK